MVNVEWVSAILTLRAWFWEKSLSLKYCRITCKWADGATLRSYPHIALLTMQTRTKGFAPLSTRSLSLHGCISARVSPTCNLTVLCNYSQRSAYVEFPCGGLAFRLSLQYASDTYSYHTYCMPTVKRTRRSGQSSILGTYLMIKNTVLTKTFHFRAWTKRFFLWK